MGIILYHYTSFDVLKKILSSKRLRFTKMDSLTDRSEYKYGIELLKNKIEEYENNNHLINKFDVELLDEFSFYDDLFSISFTENGDNLAFWNSYYVDKLTPVSLGFMSDNLFESDLILNKCKYGDPYPSMGKERYDWFKKLFDIKNILQISKNLEYIQITFQTAHIKHKAFEIEREWRSVSFGLENGLYGKFVRNHKEIEYFDQPINIENLCKIIVGPSKLQGLNYQEIVSQISKYGLNCRTKKSMIPLEL